MKDRDNCITAINTYIKNHDNIMAKFNSEYESVKANNKQLADLNEQNEKDHATKRAAYQKEIDAFTKDDIGNNTNCGSLPDSSKWVDVSRDRPNIFSKWVCKYRYSPTEINRLMIVWDDENKFIPHTIPPLPTPPNDTVNLNCCSNKIDLSDSVMAKDALKNVDQKCNQSITNNNRDGGSGTGSGSGDSDSGGGDGDSTNNKNTDSETSTSDQYAKRRKIIALCIFLFIFLLLAITVGVYLVYK